MSMASIPLVIFSMSAGTDPGLLILDHAEIAVSSAVVVPVSRGIEERIVPQQLLNFLFFLAPVEIEE